jgi:hypothetical protein
MLIMGLGLDAWGIIVIGLVSGGALWGAAMYVHRRNLTVIVAQINTAANQSTTNAKEILTRLEKVQADNVMQQEHLIVRLEALTAGMHSLTTATNEQTKIISAAFRSRIEVERREQRRKLVQFFVNSNCFSTISDVNRLLPDLDPSLVGRMRLNDSPRAALDSVVETVLQLGSDTDISYLMGNAADVFDGLATAIQFRQLRDDLKLP